MIPDCGGIKSKAVAKVIFGIMYRWTELRNLQEPFIWMVVSCTISSATSGQKRTKVTGMTTVKKLGVYNFVFEKNDVSVVRTKPY